MGGRQLHHEWAPRTRSSTIVVVIDIRQLLIHEPHGKVQILRTSNACGGTFVVAVDCIKHELVRVLRVVGLDFL